MYEIYFQIYYGTYILNIHKIVDDDFIIIVHSLKKKGMKIDQF